MSRKERGDRAGVSNVGSPLPEWLDGDYGVDLEGERRPAGGGNLKTPVIPGSAQA